MSQSAIQKQPGESRSSRRRMSVAEWALLPDSEPGELVDGRLVEEESASGVHELIVGWLIFVLTSWIDAREGFVFGSDLKFAVAPDLGRKPDVSVFFAGSPLPPPEGVVEVPPDIAVEVVSSSPKDDRRDRVEKLDAYAAFGVPWYWIVASQLRTLDVFARGADGRYACALAASGGVVEKVPGCDGLRLDLGRLWARVDRLVAAEKG